MSGKAHLHAGHVVARAGCRSCWQIVLEMDDQLVARVDPKRGGLKTTIRHIAITDESLRICCGDELESDFQHSVLALQLGWRGGGRAGSKARANLVCRVRSRCSGSREFGQVLRRNRAPSRMNRLSPSRDHRPEEQERQKEIFISQGPADDNTLLTNLHRSCSPGTPLAIRLSARHAPAIVQC